MIHHYQIAGLSVASDVAMPGARQITIDGLPEISIARGDVPDRLEGATILRNSWSADASRVLARATEARFLVSDGRSIAYEPERGFSPADCAPYLGGPIFGFLMHQRGAIVFHASAVVVDDQAVLFCGPSGMGKSTMAAALCQRNHALLADDICSVSFDEAGVPAISPDSRMHRLTDASVAALQPPGTGTSTRIMSTHNKYLVEPAVAAPGHAVRIGTIYVLERGVVPAIEPLNTAEAADGLGRNAYRPAVVRRMGQTQHYLDAITAILGHAPVRRLRLACHLETLDAALALIERDLAVCETVR